MHSAGVGEKGGRVGGSGVVITSLSLPTVARKQVLRAALVSASLRLPITSVNLRVTVT